MVFNRRVAGFYVIKAHDAKNTTLANIAVERECITLGRVLHARTNLIKVKLPANVSASYSFAASWNLVQYKHCNKSVVQQLVLIFSACIW